MDELDDSEIDAIQEDAADAALHAWGPLGSPICRPNPYSESDARHEVWAFAFRQAYASENGR